MRASKGQLCVIVLSAIILAFAFVCCVFFQSSPFCSEEGFGTDMKHRRAEVCCSFTGVNPFHVWCQDVHVDGFAPMSRPDRPRVEKRPGDLVVHSYPVWHTIWFFFYGLLPESACVGIVSFLFGLGLSLVLARHWHDSRMKGISPLLVITFVLAMSVDLFINCFFLLNYGVLLAAAIVLMIAFLERGSQVFAGICWAFVMIKPQVGLLLFFPLLFARKYKAILSAIVTCLGLTVVMSVYYHESPVALILQIPQIGAPYQNSVLVNKVLAPVFGKFGQYVLMAVFGFVCAYACYKTRLREDWLVKIAPVMLCFPMWTYSNGADAVVKGFFWYALVAFRVFDMRETGRRKWWVTYAIYSCLTVLFMSVWNNLCNTGVFDSAGRGWIYQIVTLAHLGVSLMCLYYIVRKPKGSVPTFAPSAL